MRKTIAAGLLALSLLAFQFTVYAGNIPGSPESAIVFVLDVSGSMNDNDPQQHARDAARLAVDLAPDHASVGIVTVSDRVVSELPLTDVTTREGRQSSKAFINSIYTDGNTSFVPGLQRAVEMLEHSPAEQKRIVAILDFQEGGYNLAVSTNEYSEAISALSMQARDLGIEIDMLLFGEAPATSLTAAQFIAMPGITGGSLITLDDPAGLCAAVEDIYFDSYDYFQSAYTLRGEGTQTLQVPMPTSHVERARIFVSASNPVDSFGATYAGADLDGERTSTYSIIDLDKPAQEGISITVTPGETALAYVYLLLEYDVELALSVEHDFELPEGEEEYIQTTTLTAKIVDTQTGSPIVEAAQLDAADYTIWLFGPDGQAVEFHAVSADSIAFTQLDAGAFGQYEVAAELSADSWVFFPQPATIEIPDVRPDVEAFNYWPIIIIIVALVIVVTAILLYYRKKRKEPPPPPPPFESKHSFVGKLDMYVTKTRDDIDIPPLTFDLFRQQKKEISLHEILFQCKIPSPYPGSPKIYLVPGKNNTLNVVNESECTILIGRDLLIKKRSHGLGYNEKIHITFEDEITEMEIHYKSVRPSDRR